MIVTITNPESNKSIEFQIFGRNIFRVLSPGEEIQITVKSEKEKLYYQALSDILGFNVGIEESVDPDPKPEPEEPVEEVEVSDQNGLDQAINNPDIKSIKLSSNMDVSKEFKISKSELFTFDGNGNKLTTSAQGKVMTIMSDSTMKNVSIESEADNTEWHSSYGIQFYTGNHTVENAVLTGGNAGMIVNGATVTLSGTIDVSGNTFGGIEVCKGSNPSLSAGVLNINNATLVNTTEEYGKPTIWIDGNTDSEGIVNGAENMTMIEVQHGETIQKQYYLNAENAVDPNPGITVNGEKYNSLTDAINAVPDNELTTVTLGIDTEVTSSVEIPSGKKIILDLDGHTIKSSGFKGRPITNRGDLTVTGNGTITSEDCESDGTGCITNEGILKIESGTFKGGQGANGACINNKSECTIEDGEFIGCPRAIQNLGTLTVNGGNFVGSDSYSGNEGNAIVSAQGATTTITDGTFTGHMNAVSNIDNGQGCQLTINGGTFKTDGYNSSGAIYNGTGNTLTIEDCEASTSGDSGCTVSNKGTAVINGGTFIGDNCNKQCYTIDSGQTSTSGASMELGENVIVTGTFGAVRAVSGEMTIKGGSYKVVDCEDHSKSDFYALYVASEDGAVTVNVEDGTFESLNNDCVRVGNPGFDQSAIVNISGGSFTAPSGKEAVEVAGTGSASLTGGSYSSNVESYVDSGYIISEDNGRFVVTTENNSEETIQIQSYTKEELVSKSKSDLQALASEMGLDTSGTKDTIADRIIASK